MRGSNWADNALPIPVADMTAKHTALADLLDLGPKSQQMLIGAGIPSLEVLQQLGAVRAYLQVKASGAPASLNLLWALEGALCGLHWREVAREHRTSLLLALEVAQELSSRQSNN
jgi:DNA transformation protein